MKKPTINDLLTSTDFVVDLLPDDMEEVTRQDAIYHSDVIDEWVELNQITTERNEIFHKDALEKLTQGLPSQAAILELGAGVGYDTQKFLESSVPFKCYVTSEISKDMMSHVHTRLSGLPSERSVRYCCLDANNLRVADGQFDAVWAIATLHHFPNLDRSLAEIDRVSRPGAKIVFAIEPNKLWSRVLVAGRPIYRKLFASKSHSAADEEAEGFDLRDFNAIGEKHGWTLESVTPVWFSAGFLHLGLEAVYRIMRLKKRLRVPVAVEHGLIKLDKAFFSIPASAHLAWHYTAVYRKTN